MAELSVAREKESPGTEVIVIYYNITVTKEDARFNQLNSCTAIIGGQVGPLKIEM